MMQQNGEQSQQRKVNTDNQKQSGRPQVMAPQQETVRVSTAAIQQMQERQVQMENIIRAQALQLQVKTYTQGQIQILMCCETIDQVLEEFTLGNQKQKRLCQARDYLLKLANLDEYMTQEQVPVQEPFSGIEDGGNEQEVSLDNLYEEPQADQSIDDGDNGSVMSDPRMEATTKEEIFNITKKMEKIRSDDAIVKKEQGKSGIEKLRDFVSKKNKPVPELSPPIGNSDPLGATEGMG